MVGGMYSVLSERCIAASGRTAGAVGEERTLLAGWAATNKSNTHTHKAMVCMGVAMNANRVA